MHYLVPGLASGFPAIWDGDFSDVTLAFDDFVIFAFGLPLLSSYFNFWASQPAVRDTPGLYFQMRAVVNWLLSYSY